MPENRPSEPIIRPRRGDLEAASQRHAFRPSGEYVGPANVEICDLCGLAQRGGLHAVSGHACADPNCDFLKPYAPPGNARSGEPS